MKPRKLWTDGWNSFWHFFFGVIAIKYLWIILLFTMYQLNDYQDKNLLVDMAEFFLGFFFISFMFEIMGKV